MNNSSIRIFAFLVMALIGALLYSSHFGKGSFQFVEHGKGLFLLDTRTGSIIMFREGMIEKYELNEGKVQFLESGEIEVE